MFRESRLNGRGGRGGGEKQNDEPVVAGMKGEAMQTRPPKTWKRQRGQRRPTL